MATLPVPNFIIVGAMKAGTTSFGAMLREHPRVFMPEGETHFFDVDRKFNGGLEAYRQEFVGWQNEPYIGEKTPTYSYREDIPARIAQLLPDVKLIWLFRNPVERMYSHYWFFVKRGLETMPFAVAIEREQQHQAPKFSLNYVDRSIYITQVQRFLQYFKREQMLFWSLRISCATLPVT